MPLRLWKNNMKHYNIPIFVPHNGCPNDCSFCNQKRITGHAHVPDAPEVYQEVEKNLKTLEADRYVEIAFFGGSFTGIEEEKQRELLSAASSFIQNGEVDGIRLSTRPDYITPHVLDYLKDYGVTAIELGVQSMDDEVLKKNNRGHTAADVEKAAKLIKSYGCFQLGLQQMLGLYGSSQEKDFETAVKIAALSPQVTRIYPTVVLEGTHLFDLYMKGKYIPFTVEQAVETGSKIYELYTENGIRVIRMGLQATEVINEKDEKMYGPYHSSYGELVKSRVLRTRLEKQLNGLTGEVVVLANPRLVSKLVGNKRCNVLYFKKKLGITLIVKPDPSVEEFSINVTKI